MWQDKNAKKEYSEGRIARKVYGKKAI